ncbi:DUF4255 domain-containing protein [Enterobacter ludwigii]
MPTIIASSTAIIDVNKALYAVLREYLDPESSGDINIRFDLPEVDSTQSLPTVSVFLYDVHEDLQLRQSEPARLNVTSSALRAGWVNLNCNYLITFWETQSTGGEGDGPESQPDNQAIQIMNRTLQALLNNRELSGVAGAWTRIIPPQENLNSLGNFWQSLGNRPRLSLAYSITVPTLLDNNLPQLLVKTVYSEITQTANVDMTVITEQLRQRLCRAVAPDGGKKLSRVIIESEQQEVEGRAINISVNIYGLVDKAQQESLGAVFEIWSDNTAVVTEIDGIAVHIVDLQKDGLVFLE